MENLPEKNPEIFVALNPAMPDQRILESERVKTNGWLIERDRLDEICLWVSSGGSLIDLCKILSISYASVIKWINRDDARRRQYDLSLKDREEWMVQELISELKKIASVDIRRAFDADGNLLSIHAMPEDVARALSAVDIDEDNNIKVRMVDKLKAIEVLGKNLKMFVDRIEHSGTLTLEEMVAGTLPNDAPATQ